MEEEQTASKKIYYIAGGIILFLIIGGVVVFSLMGRNDPSKSPVFSWPFGNNINPNGDPANDSALLPSNEGDEQNLIDQAGKKLRQLSTIPSAGAIALQNSTGAQTVRFVAKETGNIHDVDISTLQTNRVTNTAIPRVEQAFFMNEGKNVILQYVAEPETIKTVYTQIVPATGENIGHLETSFLPDNITSLSVSPNGKEVFFLVQSSTGVVGFTLTPPKTLSGYISCPSTPCKQVFNFPFSEWNTEYFGNTQILLTTKPAVGIQGFAYTLDTSSGALTRVLGNTNALTTHTDFSGKKFLFSELQENTTVLRIATPENKAGSHDPYVIMPFNTLPEKCTWGTSADILYCGAPSDTYKGNLPDNWYQGIMPSVDTIWKYTISNSETTIASAPQIDAGVELDTTYPFISAGTNENLIFTNKTDSTLWALSLHPEQQSNRDDSLPSEQSDILGSTPESKK